jgi:hypothetical protein
MSKIPMRGVRSSSSLSASSAVTIYDVEKLLEDQLQFASLT